MPLTISDSIPTPPFMEIEVCLRLLQGLVLQTAPSKIQLVPWHTLSSSAWGAGSRTWSSPRPSASSASAYRQAKMTSSSVDGLPNQTAVSNSHHTKPRSICRNFVYRGVCGDKACPRAHVPYNDMVDLLAYLTERDDFPPELRFVTKRLTRPDLSRCRQQYSSDRICSYFLHGSCRLNERCPRAHLRSFQIYRSLLRTANVKPDQARGTATQPSPVTPVDPTTSTDPPILAADND